MTTVAVLGTGRMGGAMVGTLRRAGFDVTAWNRDRSKAEAVARSTGAGVAGTPPEAVVSAEIVISSLANDAAVEETYTDVVPALRAGTVVLEMSTVAPSTIRSIAPGIAGARGELLDAPVSGSVSLVEAGELTIMIGGAAQGLERARPVLEALAKKVIHVGELGSGATMKLAVNALIHGLNGALSEALVLAERAGVERTTAYEVFASGAAAAPFVLYKRAAFERPDETPVAFTLDLVAKDLDLILELAREVGAPMDQATQNRATVLAAIASGLGESDISAVAEFLRARRSDEAPR